MQSLRSFDWGEHFRGRIKFIRARIFALWGSVDALRGAVRVLQIRVEASNIDKRVFGIFLGFFLAPGNLMLRGQKI